MNNIISMEVPDVRFPVNGRELHERLEVGTPYHIWLPRMVEYGFEEGKDYEEVLNKNVHNPLGGRPMTDHLLTLSMAKEICMLQRSEKGREVRRYLIGVEEQWNSPEAVMSRALQMAQRNMEEMRESVLRLSIKAAEDAPKVLFADTVEASDTSILIGELAKYLRQRGVEIGQNRLFERMRKDGYLISRGESRNIPSQYAIENGWMEIKQRTVINPDGSNRITRTPMVTGKGQIYFIHRYRTSGSLQCGMLNAK